MKIKQTLLSGACVAAIVASMAASASAADLSPRPMYKAPQMVAVPQFSWTGCYVGGNAGYARASHTWNGVATTPTSISGAAISQRTSGGGFVGGGQLGCDYQSGNWVIGIEGMGDGSTINKTTGINLAPGATFNDKVTSFETVTARIGWAIDRTLLYAKAGGAWDQSSGTINGSALGLATKSHSINNSGWVVGGGVEYAFAPNWSGKVEYDYMGFGNQTVNYPITTAGPVSFTHQNLQAILAGLNYRFYSGGQ